MRNRFIVLAVLSVLATAFLPSAGVGAATPFQEALRGIKALSVETSVYSPEEIVEPVFLELAMENVAVNTLKRLMPASVIIEGNNLSFSDCVFLSASVFKREDGGYYGSVQLEVERSVQLSGITPATPFRSVVYSHTYLIIGKSGATADIMGVLPKLLEEFAAAYLKATSLS